MLVPIYMVIYKVIYSKTGLALSKPVLSRWVISLPNGYLWALHISWISEGPSLLYKIIQLSNNGTTSLPLLFFLSLIFLYRKRKSLATYFANPCQRPHCWLHSVYCSWRVTRGVCSQSVHLLDTFISWHF